MPILLRNYAIAILLTLASMLINHVLGFNTERHDIGEYARHGVTAIFWCSIFLTVVQIRAVSGAEHSFMHAFRNGSLYSVLYAASFSVFMVFYQHVVNPRFYPTYREFFEARLKAAQIAPDLMAIKMRQFDMNFNGDFPSYVLLFLYMAMGGVIMSAIAGVLFRNPAKTPEKNG
ncbi:MAG: hypothetical protein OHK0011_20480 [Turneriella sp.]